MKRLLSITLLLSAVHLQAADGKPSMLSSVMSSVTNAFGATETETDSPEGRTPTTQPLTFTEDDLNSFDAKLHALIARSKTRNGIANNSAIQELLAITQAAAIDASKEALTEALGKPTVDQATALAAQVKQSLADGKVDFSEILLLANGATAIGDPLYNFLKDKEKREKAMNRCCGFFKKNITPNSKIPVVTTTPSTAPSSTTAAATPDILTAPTAATERGLKSKIPTGKKPTKEEKQAAALVAALKAQNLQITSC